MKRPIRNFLLLIFMLVLEIPSFSNNQPLSTGDSLLNQHHYAQALHFFKQSLESPKAKQDSTFRAEIFHRLCLTAEYLQHYSNAISYHLQWRKLHPFFGQKENQIYIDKVIRLIPKSTDSLGLCRLYYRYGLLLTKETKRQKALDYFYRSLALAKGIKNNVAEATIANDIAGEYWDAGQNELSTKMYKEALKAAIKAKDSNRMAAAYLNLAGNYTELGDFKTGIPIHLKALKIKELLKDKSRISYYYQQTAGVYHQARNFKKWEEYTLKAYRIRNDKNRTSALEKTTLYGEMGGIANYNKETEKAILYYDTLLNLSNKIAYLNGKKIAYDNLALIYKQKGQYKKALEKILQSEAIFNDNPYYQITHNNTKAELLKELKREKEALKLVQKNLQMPSIDNYAIEKLHSLRLLYNLNIELRHYQAAFKWNDSLQRLENQLRDADVRKEMAQLEEKYQAEKKEQQIDLLTAENQIKSQRMQQALLFIGFLIILVVLILVLFYYRRNQAAYKQSELQQQLLRSQMNPHFIFNIMGSIQSYLYKNEASKAAEYLSRFASLSRSVLEFSSKESIRLKEEIEMLQNYIELERARMEHPFEVEYKIPEDLEIDFIEIPPMLLQPFVENAIKHGFKNRNYPGKLSLCFKELNHYIAVEILDNGRGIEVDKSIKHKSKALEIFHQRKKGIERKFKKELIFEFQNLKTIDDTKTGVRVYLQLPILNDD